MTAATGMLVVCATPIGNLGDVTLRVLDALTRADAILAEDTRVTRTLLARYDIKVPLERYDAHTDVRKTRAFVERMLGGETLALVSDAGTPGISDPGHALIEEALAADVTVDVLPGASAILTALVASGLPTHAFYFGGFLPRKAGAIKSRLDQLAALDATLVFYESPHRTASTAAIIAKALPGREAAMARELTKMHQEVLRADVTELAEALQGRELKGEVVLVVGPPQREAARDDEFDPEALAAAVDALVAQGTSRREAVRVVAQQTGAPRNLVYRAAIGSER